MYALAPAPGGTVDDRARLRRADRNNRDCGGYVVRAGAASRTCGPGRPRGDQVPSCCGVLKDCRLAGMLEPDLRGADPLPVAVDVLPPMGHI